MWCLGSRISKRDGVIQYFYQGGFGVPLSAPRVVRDGDEGSEGGREGGGRVLLELANVRPTRVYSVCVCHSSL